MTRLPVNTYTDDLIPRLLTHTGAGGTIKSFAELNRLEYSAFKKWLSREGVYVRRHRPNPNYTVMHIAVKKEFLAELARLAKERNMSMSAFVRGLVETTIEEEHGKKENSDS